MYCPQCGQQQVSDVTRFCSRCGFLLDGVAAVLASGGRVPVHYMQPGNEKLSPRSKGIRQGAMMMLLTLFVVPVISILSVFVVGGEEVIIPLTAIFFFVGGLLRMLYALLMEDAYPVNDAQFAAPYMRVGVPPVDPSARNVALPPTPANSGVSLRQRPPASEIYQPPSITENTTRLLDKEDAKNT